MSIIILYLLIGALAVVFLLFSMGMTERFLQLQSRIDRDIFDRQAMMQRLMDAVNEADQPKR